MTKRTKQRTRVRIGGRRVPLLRAALIAVEADRLGVLPRKVGTLEVPDPAPTHVVIARQTVSVYAAAILGEQADAQGVTLEALVTRIVHEKAERIGQRARRPETRKALVGTWSHRESRGDHANA